ncbi:MULTISPECIES: hypothetical protein [Methylobacterium]|uniref:Uncharacterized protein n=2 Tax=Methylobacterium TaxID=407 RepID=A0A0C6FLG9_9HYPH|nr:hypothetical protein [Methylobacterium aquaticum]BAQ46024.1 hypothetical protein Maq22A_c14170 [Methylobacterium aquaticum]
MSDPKIDAPRITKPIQLLAAWLIGLVIIDDSFLGAGVSIGDSWERSALVSASICNVPVFLLAIFVLQTRFRPELQEDVFYSTYIHRKTNSQIEVNKIDVLSQKLGDIQSRLDFINSLKIESRTAVDAKQIDWSDWKVAINVQLPFFADIKKSLNDSEIPLFLAFGENKPLTNGYCISISDHMGSQHVIALLKAVLDFPFDRIVFW